MESRLDLGGVGESPSIQMIEDAVIFGGKVVVFVQKGVSGRGNCFGDPEHFGNAFAELGFANTEVALESEN